MKNLLFLSCPRGNNCLLVAALQQMKWLRELVCKAAWGLGLPSPPPQLERTCVQNGETFFSQQQNRKEQQAVRQGCKTDKQINRQEATQRDRRQHRQAGGNAEKQEATQTGRRQQNRQTGRRQRRQAGGKTDRQEAT